MLRHLDFILEVLESQGRFYQDVPDQIYHLKGSLWQQYRGPGLGAGRLIRSLLEGDGLEPCIRQSSGHGKKEIE